MEIISLGGVGGCQLATALRMHNYPAYPYDWLVTAQSFILDSFDNMDNFFTFDSEYVYNRNQLVDKHKRAIMLHDFTHFENEKAATIEKYKRRFHRLHEALISGKKLLFVRILENMNEDKMNDHTQVIYIREDEDISLWEQFMERVINTYQCSCHLLLITDEIKYRNIDTTYKNITISYTDNKTTDTIYHMIHHHV